MKSHRCFTMIKRLTAVSLLLCSFASAGAAEVPGIDEPIDTGATAETRTLHANLIKLADADGFAFGNQGDYHTGVGWHDEPDDVIRPSDIYRVLNVHAGVSGYNANWLFHDDNTPNDNAFRELAKEMEIASRRGALITLHWPMDNPVTQDDDSNCDGCSHLIDTVLKEKVFDPRGGEGENYALWAEWMDVLVDFLNNHAKDRSGQPIPILFRPWHEMNQGENGVGRWYQVAKNSPEEYRALWQQTVNYLRDHDVHNLLYVYAPSLNALACDGCDRGQRYIDNFPGDAWVDVMAGDGYFAGVTDDFEHFDNLVQGIEIIVDKARLYGKIPALAETGYKDGLQHDRGNNFWYSQWLLGIKGALPAKIKKLAYVMSWSNAGTRDDPSFFVPYPDPRAKDDEIADFRAFHAHDYTLFAGDLRTLFGSLP